MTQKTFSGAVMDGGELEKWKRQVLGVSSGYSTLTMGTPAMHAGPKDIELEARFFVVDNVVVTGSSYRTLGRQIMYDRVDADNPLFGPLLDFARKMVLVDCSRTELTPAEPIAQAYVLDVAQAGGEPKVVEVNTINSAGFYASDMGAVVRALENLRY